MTDCIPWEGRLDDDGYGKTEGRLAHRVIYEAQIGPIPEDLEIDHLCRNRACVNLDHLEPVTHLENVRRSMKTHCKNGHPLSGDNLYVWSGDGYRRCRACNRKAVASYDRRNQDDRDNE